MILDRFPDNVSVPLASPSSHALDDNDNEENTDASTSKLCGGRNVPRGGQEARTDGLPITTRVW